MTTNNDPRTCQTCAFSELIEDGRHICHRHPPKMSDSYFERAISLIHEFEGLEVDYVTLRQAAAEASLQPEVVADDWCGEWKQPE